MNLDLYDTAEHDDDCTCWECQAIALEAHEDRRADQARDDAHEAELRAG